jgi:multiple antibiotic resistance protein
MELSEIFKAIAIFPQAVPCIASPGAMVAVALLTDNHRFSIPHRVITGLITLGELFTIYRLLLSSRWIYKKVGDTGTSSLSRVMGMLLAGIKQYFDPRVGL